MKRRLRVGAAPKAGAAIAKQVFQARVVGTELVAPWLMDEAVKAIGAYFEQVEEELASDFQNVMREAAAADDTPPEVADLLGKLADPEAQAFGGILQTLIGFAIGNAAASVFAPPFQALANRTWAAFQNQRLDPGSTAGGLVRGIIDPDTAEQEAAETGFSANRLGWLAELARRRLTPEELRALVNREELTEAEAGAELRLSGFDDAGAAASLGLREVIPGIGDLVSMAVREAFSPAVAQAFGQFEDFPEAVVEWAEKQGLSREWAERYWAAHWSLPSANQGFEMIHRGVIDEGELNLLLRALDVMPFWRDRLAEIAFSPFTRVDIRRMYRDGVIDIDQVYRAHLDIGYDPERAQLLTDWVARQRTATERELTKAEIVALYEGGLVPRDRAAALLGELGFVAEEAEQILNLADARRGRRFAELAISRVRARYVTRRVSRPEAGAALDQLEVDPEERGALLDTWDIEREVDRPQLTTAQIGRLVDGAHLTEEEGRLRWSELGYRPRDIDLLLLIYAPPDDAPTDPTDETRALTKSDIGRLLREGTIETATAVARWIDLGYTRRDAEELATLYAPPPDEE